MQESPRPHRAPGASAIALLATLAALGSSACTRQSARAQALSASRASHASEAGRASCLPSHEGYLRARLRGASDMDIDWSGGQLQCDGDPRPDGRGIRLTFAGTAEPGHHHLRFLFGIDAPPAAGETSERPANVTVIFEGESRIYSTRGDGNCTVDQLRQQPLQTDAVSGGALLRVSARGFCIGAAGSLDGSDTLLLSRFDFTGLVRQPSAQ